MSQEQFQGIILFNVEGSLTTKLYFSDQHKEFEENVKAGKIIGYGQYVGKEGPIVEYKWLNQPVDRDTIANITRSLYDEIFYKTAKSSDRKDPPKTPPRIINDYGGNSRGISNIILKVA